MSTVTSDTSQSSWRKPMAADGSPLAESPGLAINMHENGHVFEMPARLFEQLPFAIYICDQDGLVLRYNCRAAELWGRSPEPGDPKERFCGSYRMYRPDGRLLPHDQCPMADVLRTGMSVRQQEVHIERQDGSRGIALVDIEALKDGDGNIIGAVNCFQDITQRKRAEEREIMLVREVNHRARNLLAKVQAAVQLTDADTVKDFKAKIQGRLKALSHAHSLLAQSSWAGADLHSLVRGELAPYGALEKSRADISGPTFVLEPKSAQSIAMVLHELTTNAVKYGALSVPTGRLRVEWSRGDAEIVIRWSEADGPDVKPPCREGFGTRLIGPLIHELGGKLRYDWNPSGLGCEMIIPLARLAEATPLSAASWQRELPA